MFDAAPDGSLLVNRRAVIGGAAALAAVSTAGALAWVGQRSAGRGAPGDLSILAWDGGPVADRTFGRLQRRWVELGGGRLHLRKLPAGDLDRAIRFTAQGGHQPDIFMASVPNVVSYVALGLLEPVTDLFSAEDLEDFFPVVRRSASVGGEFYGPSTNENGQALYYDRRLVARHGIEPPSTLAGAWTWAEALEVFKAVQAGERRRRGTRHFWAIRPSDGEYGFYFSGLFPRTNGRPGSPAFALVSGDGRRVDGYLNHPEALEGMQFMQDLYQLHQVAPLSTHTDLFFNDQVGFWLATPYQCSEILRRRPGIDLATTPVPYLRTPLVHSGAFAWVMNKQAPEPGAARRFIRFVGSADGNDIVSRGFTSPPIRKSMIAARPELQRPPLSLFVDALEHWSVLRPVTPGFSEYDMIWNRLAADIVAGGAVDRLVQRAVGAVEASLRRYG